MPASRSRTDRWMDLLHQVFERGGALELAIRTPDQSQPDGENAEPHPDVLWRVRMLNVGEHTLAVEQPGAAGKSIRFRDGLELIAAFTVGQNRWMFTTRTVGYRVQPGYGPHGHASTALLLEMPSTVERCVRRQFYRMSAASLSLPRVQVWPLLDPHSVAAAEAANRALMNDRLAALSAGRPLAADQGQDAADTLLLPEVGPNFCAQLVNLSGGGIGLSVAPSEAAHLSKHTFFWLRVDLAPRLPAPLAVTARRVHTHLDSNQNTYAGMAFDFAHNPQHQPFVNELLTRYVENMMQAQRIAQTHRAYAG